MSTITEISALLGEIKSMKPKEEKPKVRTTRKKKTKPEEEFQPIHEEQHYEEQHTKEPPKTLTFEELQTAFGMKSKEGYTAEVKALIMIFGAKKLSEIDPADYPALIKQLEMICSE